MATQLAQDIRDRVLPMLQVAARNYMDRVPAGYPIVVDAPAQGILGLEIDPGHSLYFVEDGGALYADFYYRSTRWDTRSSASREKFAGASMQDRRELDRDVSDQALRNLIAELGQRFQTQQLFIHTTDT